MKFGFKTVDPMFRSKSLRPSRLTPPVHCWLRLRLPTHRPHSKSRQPPGAVEAVVAVAITVEVEEEAATTEGTKIISLTPTETIIQLLHQILPDLNLTKKAKDTLMGPQIQPVLAIGSMVEGRPTVVTLWSASG